jgi:glutaconate CoA-transferase subunit B
MDSCSSPKRARTARLRRFRSLAKALVTGKMHFTFDATLARFTLARCFRARRKKASVPRPSASMSRCAWRKSDVELVLVRDEMLETYPEFCARVFGRRQVP